MVLTHHRAGVELQNEVPSAEKYFEREWDTETLAGC